MANPKILEQKQLVIDEIKSKIENSNGVVLFDYRGLTDAEIKELEGIIALFDELTRAKNVILADDLKIADKVSNAKVNLFLPKNNHSSDQTKNTHSSSHPLHSHEEYFPV